MSDAFVTGDGCRIAWRYDGPADAPVLLLSNSLGTTLDMWWPQIEALQTRFRVLRYDSRGHGGSDAPAGAYSLDRLGRDVIELLDHLGIAQVDFCGLSLGGMVGQWLGIRDPARVRRLIIANSSSYMGPPSAWDARIALVLEGGMTPIADASIARWFTADFPDAAPTAVSRIRSALLSVQPAGYAGCCAAIRDMDMRRAVQLVEPHTLIIGGTRDPATPREHSIAMADSIRASQLVMLEAAHLSNVEKPAEFTQACLNFLS